MTEELMVGELSVSAQQRAYEALTPAHYSRLNKSGFVELFAIPTKTSVGLQDGSECLQLSLKTQVQSLKPRGRREPSLTQVVCPLTFTEIPTLEGTPPPCPTSTLKCKIIITTVA